jgi:hypothetical protein
MASGTEDFDDRPSNGDDSHLMANAAGIELAEARLEHALSTMDGWGERRPSLDGSRMIRFELRVGETVTDAAAALRWVTDAGHSPVPAWDPRAPTHACAGAERFWVCCDSKSCREGQSEAPGSVSLQVVRH